MSTLGGIFERKPHCKRNFLLENIRDVCKERHKKNQPGNLQMMKLRQNTRKVPQPFLKAANRNTQLEGASITSMSPQTIQLPKHKTGALTDLCRQQNCGIKCHTNSASQTTCDLHSLCRQKDDGNIKDYSREDVSPVCKYIDEENVPFRWTHVCPSLISHTLCHQSVQTFNEDNLDTLVDGSIKYPSSHKTAVNVKDKGRARPEWSTYADEANSPSESVASESKFTDPSTSPVESNDISSTQQIASSRSEKKSLSESSGRNSPTIQRDQTSSPTRSHYPFPSNWNGGGVKKYKLKDIGNKNFRDLVTDETDSVNLRPQVKEQVVKPDLQRNTNPDKAGNLKSVSLESNGQPSRPPTSYQRGVIPKYLAKRINKQKVLSRNESKDSNKVDTLEEERRTALRKSTEEFDILVAELNKMPVRTDTLRTRNRKVEIEKELNVLERRIRALTRISDL